MFPSPESLLKRGGPRFFEWSFMDKDEKEALLARFLDYLSHSGVNLAHTESGRLELIKSGGLVYIRDFLNEDDD